MTMPCYRGFLTLLRFCVCLSYCCVVCLAGLPPRLSAKAAAAVRNRCGSELGNDLVFVCGDRGVNFAKGSVWARHRNYLKGQGIIDKCCKSPGCNLYHLQKYCAKPQSAVRVGFLPALHKELLADPSVGGGSTKAQSAPDRVRLRYEPTKPLGSSAAPTTTTVTSARSPSTASEADAGYHERTFGHFKIAGEKTEKKRRRKSKRRKRNARCRERRTGQV